MNMAEKLEMARTLAALGVDVIEAGFPIASVGDFEAVRAIAADVTGSSVCGLARCNERDIDRAWEAIQFAQKPQNSRLSGDFRHPSRAQAADEQDPDHRESR